MRRGGMADRTHLVFENWNKNKLQARQDRLVFSGHGSKKRAALIVLGCGRETANRLRDKRADRLIAKLHGGRYLPSERQPKRKDGGFRNLFIRACVDELVDQH
jgi:hypothetical protein